MKPEYQRELKRQHIELLKGELRNAEADLHRSVTDLSDHTRLGYKTEPPLQELQSRLEYFLGVVERLRDARDGLQTMPKVSALALPDLGLPRDSALATLEQSIDRRVGAERMKDLVSLAPPTAFRRRP